MHVLGNIGHSFSQRRKTHKPKDLHIRKVSFSGSSLSSSPSTSSTSSASTARAPSSARTPTTGSTSPGFGPLSAHPTFHPPPRLHDRPLISPERCAYPPASTFFDDSTDDEDLDGGDYTVVGKAQALHFSHPPSPPPEHDDAPVFSDAQDYFTLQLASRRPPMPRSRWSDSTVQTLDLDLDLDLDRDLSSADDLDLDETPGSDAPVPLDVPNFSHKRSVSTPKRPPMRSLDSLEDLMKRSGWKRRGVVFNETEGEGEGEGEGPADL
ncbi:hypothetical protein MGU_07623 [Metarhizium guizhouense ARSEF 977]|uniref:Uncharacterized protein n=1 Tax=Metarhizium guizhouense (strain ARSEF 977) TaxID=1276136 RepID=A0A0B4H607_METGA|nr:hypothetical protein MGU_07623 [Metarhizium guizhouense ARSEF 977]